MALTLGLTAAGMLLTFSRFPTREIAGHTWLRTLECDLRADWCPAGWGWGEWRLGRDGLVGEAAADSFAVYFFGKPAPTAVDRAGPVEPASAGSIGHSDRPCDYFRHGGDFVMETEARLVRGAPDRPAEVQLLIRESNAVMDETGLALVAGRQTAIVRYRAGGTDYILGEWPVGARIEYGRWYRIGFIARDGHVRAELDGVPVFDSRTDSLPGQSRALVDTGQRGRLSLPPGRYIEPHIAVKSGAAEFRTVRLYVRPDDRWAFAR